jgi:hypothetical protein
VALVALVGCYSEPDVEINAIRTNDVYNLGLEVCGEKRDRTCKPNQLFPPDSDAKEYSVFVFVEADIRNVFIVLNREETMSVGCVRLVVNGIPLKRRLTLSAEPDPVWTCAESAPCEPVEQCPPKEP